MQISEIISSSVEIKSAVTSLLVTATIAIAARFFASRPRIWWGITNENIFLLRNENGNSDSAFVRNVTVVNNGRKKAEKLEVVFNWKPPHIEHFPHFPSSEASNKDGRYIITIDSLNPKEFINFSMLSVGNPLPDITLVRCSGFGAKNMKMAPQIVYPIWLNVVIATSSLFGFMSAGYFLSRYFFK